MARAAAGNPGAVTRRNGKGRDPPMSSDEQERPGGGPAGPAEKAAEAGSAGETGGEEAREAKAVPLLALDAQALLSWFTGVLANRAFVDIGLLADPLSGEVSKNLGSARLAIDAFECLAKMLKGGATAEESRQLDGMLADLRLNYVRQVGSDPA